MPMAGESPSVLLVTADAELAGLAEAFASRGFELECQRELRGGLMRALEGHRSLLMLDAALLNGNVVDVIRRIRLRSWAPLVILSTTGNRADRIASLEAGADDWWVKPLDDDESLARAQALVRRSGLARPVLPKRLAINGVMVDAALRRIVIDGRQLDVTSLEYDLLHYLVAAAGRIVSRDELMAVIVQRDASPFRSRARRAHQPSAQEVWSQTRADSHGARRGYVCCP